MLITLQFKNVIMKTILTEGNYSYFYMNYQSNLQTFLLIVMAIKMDSNFEEFYLIILRIPLRC